MEKVVELIIRFIGAYESPDKRYKIGILDFFRDFFDEDIVMDREEIFGEINLEKVQNLFGSHKFTCTLHSCDSSFPRPIPVAVMDKTRIKERIKKIIEYPVDDPISKRRSDNFATL